YTTYINLTGDELACVSLGVAVYLETLSLIGRSMVGEDGTARVGDYTIPSSSLGDLEYLASIFYTASVYLAVGDPDRAERMLQDVGYDEVSSRLEALGDALKLSSARGSNLSLAAALVSITPLLTCLDDDPPTGYQVIEPGDVARAQDVLAESLDPERASEMEILSNLSLLVTYQVTLVLERVSPDTGYYIYRGVNVSGKPLYPFQLQPCQGEASQAWDRVACLIPQEFPTRFHLIPSLLLAQRVAGNTWLLPLPGEEAARYYDTIDKLERFASVYETLLRSTVQVNITLTREEPQAQLPEIQDIDPTNLEQELRDILRERRLRQEINQPTPDTGQSPAQEVKVTGNLADIAKTRLSDFRDLLREVAGVRERINATLNIQATKPPSIGGVTLGGTQPLGLGMPSLNPWLLAAPILVFAAYMARDTLSVIWAMARGLLARRVRVGAPEPVLCYEAALRAAERRGLYKLPSETPREFLERARRALDPVEARGLEEATRVYEEYKYGGVGPGRAELDMCWRRVRGMLGPWGYLRRR
ncbi:MAG: DUF4129 domain-containing protein, partial [Desulfurococcales archaeon]|nr:DUF4129 domain-containing protein [Desulfurococcales archaeon]